jgi:type IV pilus assembly protein PilW
MKHTKHHKFNRKKNKGFSLVELMIALAIGLFMTIGVISVFISTSQNYRLQQAISEVQDKGRYVIRKMRQDIQEAGFRLSYDKLAVREITGAAGACNVNSAVEILEVYSNTLNGSLTGNIAQRNCYYLNGTTLEMNSIVGDENTAAVAADAAVLVPQMQDIKFSFAVDLRSDADSEINLVNSDVYLSRSNLIVKLSTTADNVATWQDVKAVKIAFIVGSEIENVVDQAQTINGAVMPDTRLYQEFTAVVALRNRIK